MNVIVNAHIARLPRTVQPVEKPVIAAIALRVRDAGAAERHVIAAGAWARATRAGVGWFGVVTYIGNDRMEDWTQFYGALFGFTPLPDEQRYGILPKGRILKSPDGSFFLQLIEPKPGILDMEPEESLHRVGFGTPDVLATVNALRK